MTIFFLLTSPDWCRMNLYNNKKKLKLWLIYMTRRKVLTHHKFMRQSSAGQANNIFVDECTFFTATSVTQVLLILSSCLICSLATYWASINFHNWLHFIQYFETQKNTHSKLDTEKNNSEIVKFNILRVIKNRLSWFTSKCLCHWFMAYYLIVIIAIA